MESTKESACTALSEGRNALRVKAPLVAYRPSCGACAAVPAVAEAPAEYVEGELVIAMPIRLELPQAVNRQVKMPAANQAICEPRMPKKTEGRRTHVLCCDGNERKDVNLTDGRSGAITAAPRLKAEGAVLRDQRRQRGPL